MQMITDDVRIKEIRELLPPMHLLRELPASDVAAQTTFASRQTIHRILRGSDDRLLVVVGPCSIHDYKAGMEYAKLLREQRERLSADLEIVMRVYFEKPRTTVGWKGLINDPYLDNSFKINDGLRLARRILLEVNELGLPAGTEFLDTITHSTPPIWWPGAPSVRVPPKARCTANSRPGCRAR
jgi:3-deoxy-7-phosphoheptulonate synthase